MSAVRSSISVTLRDPEVSPHYHDSASGHRIVWLAVLTESTALSLFIPDAETAEALATAASAAGSLLRTTKPEEAP